jgi:hypothetical protein
MKVSVPGLGFTRTDIPSLNIEDGSKTSTVPFSAATVLGGRINNIRRRKVTFLPLELNPIRRGFPLSYVGQFVVEDRH